MTGSIQSNFHQSSRNPRKAHQLGSDERVHLAIDALSKKVSISEQADQYQVSRKSVHNIVEDIISQVQQVTQSHDLSPIQVGSHDELFQSGKPVLAGVDLDSTYCYLLTTEDHRNGET
ncbi:hypothetical protein WDW89_03745 [Deltaproteobacteria bacterium TL4]